MLFCQREIKTTSHLFLGCSATIAFWNDVKQFLIQKGLKSTALTDLQLMGLSKFAPSTAIDIVLLIGSYQVYSSKLAGTSPSMTLFKGKLNPSLRWKNKKHSAVILSPSFQTNGNFFLFEFVAFTGYPLANRFDLAMSCKVKPSTVHRSPSFPFIVSG